MINCLEDGYLLRGETTINREALQAVNSESAKAEDSHNVVLLLASLA